MNRLQRYLFRNLLVATVYATIGLTLTIWLSQSLRLIELVVESGAPLRLFLWLLLLTVPTFLGVVLPIALMGGLLFTYNKLTMDSELVVMRAAGIGPMALSKPAVLLGGLVMLAVYGLNLFLTPMAHRELVRMETAIRQDHSQLMLREGVFNELGAGLSLYMRERDSDGVLHNVLIHDARNREKPYTIMGDRAVVSTEDGGMRFVVHNYIRQEYDRATDKLSQLFSERSAVDVKLLGDQAVERSPDARERSTLDLLYPQDGLPADPKMRRQLVAELHHRLSSPLLALAFTLAGLACLLSGEFNRRGQSVRITAAVLITTMLESAALGLTGAAVKSAVAVPMLYVVPAVAMVIGIWVLSRGLIPRPPSRARSLAATGA